MSSIASSNAVWYLMRSSGVVALILLTGVTILGIATTNRWSPGRLPRFVTLGLHRSVSLLAVVFLAVHIVTAAVDPYASVRLASIVVPFVGSQHPLALGAGALSLDLMLAIVVTSLLRRHLAPRIWRGVHLFAYASWPFAVLHGLGMGSDTATVWMVVTNTVCVAAFAGAVVWRLFTIDRGPKHLDVRSEITRVPPIGRVAQDQEAA